VNTISIINAFQTIGSNLSVSIAQDYNLEPSTPYNLETQAYTFEVFAFPLMTLSYKMAMVAVLVVVIHLESTVLPSLQTQVYSSKM